MSCGRNRNVPIPAKIVFLEDDRLNSRASFRCSGLPRDCGVTWHAWAVKQTKIEANRPVAAADRFLVTI